MVEVKCDFCGKDMPNKPFETKMSIGIAYACKKEAEFEVDKEWHQISDVCSDCAKELIQFANQGLDVVIRTFRSKLRKGR